MQIVSLTSPVSQGGTVTLFAQTVPQAQCNITLFFPWGSSFTTGVADGNGMVSWTWILTSNVGSGTYLVNVGASSGGLNASQTTSYVVL